MALLDGGFPWLTDHPIEPTDEYATADDVSCDDPCLVPEKPIPGDGVRMREKQRHAEQGLIRDTVLESASDKGKKAPEDEEQLRRIAARSTRHPDRQTDEPIAQNAPRKQFPA